MTRKRKNIPVKEVVFNAGFILHGPTFGLKKDHCIIQLEEPLYQ